VVRGVFRSPPECVLAPDLVRELTDWIMNRTDHRDYLRTLTKGDKIFIHRDFASDVSLLASMLLEIVVPALETLHEESSRHHDGLDVKWTKTKYKLSTMM